jgi:undecaprenyl diphosphate synthase
MPIEISDHAIESALKKQKAPLKEGPFFSKAELSSLNNPPKHIAIIPDGNRRWAHEHNVPYVKGYLEGAQTIKEIALAAKELGINVLTIYSFSTENWKRPPEESSTVMRLFDIHLKYYAESLSHAGIRLHVIGDILNLPKFLQTTIKNVCQKTASGSSLDLVFAMNYGGRDEIVRAFKKLFTLYHEGKLPTISEETISKALDTSLWPDPDLIIRTSGEQRLSNFLLWQSNYAEVFIDPVLWPDFTPKNLLNATLSYQSRKRRGGGGQAFG